MSIQRWDIYYDDVSACDRGDWVKADEAIARIAELEDKNLKLGTDLFETRLNLIAASKHNSELEAEVARLKQYEPKLLSLQHGEATIMVAHEVMSRLVDAFEALQGESNYTVSTFGRGKKAYEVVVRRKDKPSEHDLRKQAEAELLRVRTTGHAAAHELDNIAIECGLGHSPKPGTVAAHVREMKKLAELYPLAWEECKKWREESGDHDPASEKVWYTHNELDGWVHIAPADAHDQARAKAGVDKPHTSNSSPA